MPTVEVDDGAFQDLDALRDRLEYDGGELFEDNPALRFDELLVRLERESRGIFETLWGDETPVKETDRVDKDRATYDAAFPLVYPVREVSSVEYKLNMKSDWEELEEHRYDWTEHRLILAERAGPRSRYLQKGNRLTNLSNRAGWRDIAVKLRVTYDRGWEEVPMDIQSIQVAIVNRMLRKLRSEQNISSVSPEELGGAVTELDDVVNEDIRRRIDDVTSPSMATISI